MGVENKTPFEQAIERATGRTIEELRNTPLDELRRQAEKKFGKPMRITRNFPFIGRGEAVYSNVLTHEQVEALFDEALRD